MIRQGTAGEAQFGFQVEEEPQGQQKEKEGNIGPGGKDNGQGDSGCQEAHQASMGFGVNHGRQKKQEKEQRSRGLQNDSGVEDRQAVKAVED
jgi:hypothetical protein